MDIVSYIIVLEILPFWCEELQDTISGTLHKELMPTHKMMTLKVAIWFDQIMPLCLLPNAKLDRVSQNNAFTVTKWTEMKDTHIPGSSIGEQSSEDKVGWEGDEVGRLA